MVSVVHIVLFTFLAVTAVAIIRLKDLFAAVMLMGIFSLLSASLFTVMDAVDVAFTEASVGAGISTLLMLAALSLTSREEHPRHNRPKLLPLVVVVATGAALIYGTLDMPRYGDPAAPIHHHVAPHYIEHTDDEIGVPNMVTAVLASYRGYDTWGETTVIFTACVGVLLLLGGTETVRRRMARRDDGAGGGP
jgi:multicomponent Na+:H+ antiporter subunit B